MKSCIEFTGSKVLKRKQVKTDQKPVGKRLRLPVALTPLIHSLRGYGFGAVRGDMRAALNVALLAFPQGMAYAAIAGLPIEAGIMGSAVAAIIGGLWSRSRFISLGPTNATAVLAFASLASLGFISEAERLLVLPLLALLTGFFLIMGSFLGIASWIQYISRSVVAGYISAAALLIMANQMGPVLGMSLPEEVKTNFFLLVFHAGKSLAGVDSAVLILSLATAAGYFLIKRHLPKLPTVALVLVLFSLVGSLWDHWMQVGFRYLEPLQVRGMSLQLPTVTWDWISQLAGVAMVLAFLAVLEGSSIGKSLASRSGQRLPLNQEIFTMGLANVGCALAQGMPASGSLTRSQLNWSSGAATSLAGLYCGLILLVGTMLVGSYTAFVPVCVLGVLVISIGVSLINRHVLQVIWGSTRSDRIVLTTTFLAALLVRLDFAIILGAGLSILLFLRKAAQPELVEYLPGEGGHWQPASHSKRQGHPRISIIHVEGELFFGAAELFQDQLRRVMADPQIKVIILKLRNAHHLDATSILAMEELVLTMRKDDRHLIACELREDARRIFEGSGIARLIGNENIFDDDPSNPTMSIARSVRRARELLGGSEADVRIFLGGSNRAGEPPSELSQ